MKLQIDKLLSPPADELSPDDLKAQLEELEAFSAWDFLELPAMKIVTLAASIYVGLLCAGVWACGYFFGWQAYKEAVLTAMHDNIFLALAVWILLPLSLLLPLLPLAAGKVIELRCRRLAKKLRSRLDSSNPKSL